jgi:hypothetical protein
MAQSEFEKQWNQTIPVMKAVDELFCEDEISLLSGVINYKLARKIAGKYNLDVNKVVSYAKKAMGI